VWQRIHNLTCVVVPSSDGNMEDSDECDDEPSTTRRRTEPAANTNVHLELPFATCNNPWSTVLSRCAPTPIIAVVNKEGANEQNYKNRLLERAQQMNRGGSTWSVEFSCSNTGPSHCPTFTATCVVKRSGTTEYQGIGVDRRKKEAEKMAACDALMLWMVPPPAALSATARLNRFCW